MSVARRMSSARILFRRLPRVCRMPRVTRYACGAHLAERGDRRYLGERLRQEAQRRVPNLRSAVCQTCAAAQRRSA